MRLLKVFILLCSELLLSNCSDEPAIRQPTSVRGKVLVMNEGNFNWGNASVSAIDKKNMTIENAVFEKANDRKAGDVINQMVLIGSNIYLVVNNSGKIEKLDTSTLKSLALNDQFRSPRKICAVSDQIAFVTELYKNVIYQIDLNTLAILNEIPCMGWTEDMIFLNGRLWIVNVRYEKLLALDPVSLTFTDSIPLPTSPGNIVKDKNNKLWIFSGGDATHSGALTQIDPSTKPAGAGLKTISLPAISEFFPRLSINSSGDTLYVLHSGVYKIGIEESVFPAQPFIKLSDKTTYGLGLDPINSDIYVTDVKDIQQKSDVWVYDNRGQLKAGPLKAGVIASQFLFLTR
jgi:DNA-binding beta-propeller fold protein YncE